MTVAFAFMRLFRALLTLLVVVSLAFVVLRISGDPVQAILPPDASPQLVDHYRQAWGLNDPLHLQYVHYLRSIAQGDLGVSFADGRDAATVVFERLGKTLTLMLTALSLAVMAGFAAGVVAAGRPGGILDRGIMAAAILGHSLPAFFLGMILIYVFGVQLRWLPTSGSGTSAHLLLPALTIGMAWAGTVARYVRSTLLDVLSQPFITAARAHGYSEREILFREALPNIAVPTITVLGMMAGGIIAGAVVTETVFAWPGVGRLLVQAVANRDTAVVQVIVLLTAAAMVIANLAVDLISAWIDPRIAAAMFSKKGG